MPGKNFFVAIRAIGENIAILVNLFFKADIKAIQHGK